MPDRDPILAEEARDLKWRIRLLENCDGTEGWLQPSLAWTHEPFLAWARGRLREIAPQH